MSLTSQEKARARAEITRWIDGILRREDWTATELSHRAELAPSTILRLLNDRHHTFVSSFATLNKIAAASGHRIPASVLEAFSVPPPAEDGAATPATVPAPSRPPARLPVRPLSALPRHMQPPADLDCHVDRPDALAGDDTAFAAYMNDSGLAPWVPSGTLLHLTRRRDPAVGDIVAVFGADGCSRVRLLAAVDPGGYALRGANTAAEPVRMGFDEIGQVAVVVGLWRL